MAPLLFREGPLPLSSVSDRGESISEDVRWVGSRLLDDDTLCMGLMHEGMRRNYVCAALIIDVECKMRSPTRMIWK